MTWHWGEKSHAAATVWYPMNTLMCYQSCIWLPSMWLLLKNMRWTFLRNIHGCKRGKMAAFKVSAHLFLECSFNLLSRSIVRLQCHTCSCGNENTLLIDVYNVLTPHYGNNKSVLRVTKSCLTILTFKVNTKEAVVNVMNFERLWGKIHLCHSSEMSNSTQ